jgi:ATP-dependent Lhr-like helicase
VEDSLRQFHPVIARWFEERVGVPTPPQVMGWPVIGAAKSALILAPTGSGKTLAAFLAAIDWLARRLIAVEESGGTGGGGGTLWGVQILYVSPLKSLANDVQKNLLRPLEEIAEAAAEMKVVWPEITVAVRTGDTPQKERAAIARRPPHILITTPESLNLMLTSGSRAALGTVRFVIVDEVHALAGSKRGVFLSLLLERLEEERLLLNRAAPAILPAVATEGAGKAGAKRQKSQGRLKIAPGVYVPTEPLADLIRIGLSATARPEEEIGRWLAGYDDQGNPRPIEIVRSGQRKRLDLQVVCPFGPGGAGVPREGLEEEPELSADGEPKPRGTGHWPEVTRAILRMIREHRSTLVFGNSRRLIERLAARFQDELLAEAELHEREAAKHASNGVAFPPPPPPPPEPPVILPHHGSISKEVRLETEQALKRGEVDAVLATSSLELGIDIGTLDLVIQIDSPGNVAAGLQRVGRAGHLEKATAKGRLLARGLYELGSFAALVPLMFEGKVEETRVPENCLDVLAQQVVAACVPRHWKRAVLYRMFRRATPYHQLTEKQFDLVVGMLSKRAERVTNQGLRPRISFDRVNDELIILPGAAKVVLVNSGVIADTGQFPVYLAGSRRGRVELSEEMAPREAQQQRWGEGENAQAGPGVRLGELDEEFVYETKEGDRIILGSQTWRVVRIDADRVIVEPAEPGSSRMPFWRGESAPRSEMLGDAVARFYGEIERRLGAEADDATEEWLRKSHHFDEQAAENAVTFFRRQIGKGALPTHERIVVEHFVDRTGEPIIAILSPLGSRVNYALRLALEGQFARRRLPAQVVHHDDGIIIRPPVETGEIPENPLAWLRSGRLEQEIVDQLEGTALFGLRFRQNAARALMLPRMTLTQRTPLWQQRLRARHLLALVKKQRNFPIMIETYRECLQDVLNIPRVEKLLAAIESGEWSVRVVHNQEPSPFARSLFSQFTQTYLYAWDDPLVPVEIQPAVDQHILDEILQRRGEGKPAQPRAGTEKGWSAEDEEVLRRRILGIDYPARSPEELLEKIEAAGAVGVRLGLADDPRWGEWVVQPQEAGRMLGELGEKRRVMLVDFGGNQAGKKGKAAKAAAKGAKDLRWVAVENLGLLLRAHEEGAAREEGGGKKGMPLYAWRGGAIVPAGYEELPGALLESTLTAEEAQRVLVEQSLKREAMRTPEEIKGDLPWMKGTERILEEIEHEGQLQRIAREEGGDGLVWTEYADQLRSFALRRQRRSAATVDLGALQRHLLRWQRVLPARRGQRSKEEMMGEDSRGVDVLEDVLDMLMGEAFALPLWEHELFTARVPGFGEGGGAMLDGICRTGHWVWVGTKAGEGSGELAIAFWQRHLLGMRPAGGGGGGVLVEEGFSEAAQRVREWLRSQGASYFFDIQLGLSMEEGEVALAMKELAGLGVVSSDQLESLREVLRVSENALRDRARTPASPRLHATHPRHVPRPPRMARNWWKRTDSASGRAGMTAGSLGGRWFLLPPAILPDDALRLAERAADRVERFLRRTGFACRELLDAGLDGSWRDAYDVLTRMEWAGTVRRGYFVDGIAGSQFMAPGVRLEEEPSGDGITWLSMIDPANIWAQASTRWISDAGIAARVPRVAGSWVALVGGRPVLAAVSWGQRLIPLPASPPEQEQALLTLATLLPRLPRASHPFLQVKYWDQQDIFGTPAEELLRRQGFSRDTQGLRLYRQYLTASPP